MPSSSPSLVRTSTPGIFRRGRRYVVVLRDRDRRQFKRSARTLAEARVLKAELVADIERGEIHSMQRITVADYAAEWLTTYQGRTSRGIKPRTLADYAHQLETNALPKLGGLLLTEVTARHIKQYTQHLADRGLSRNSVRIQLAPVKAMLATAAEDGLIRSNPAAGVRIVVRERGVDDESRKALSDDELGRVVAEVPCEHRLVIEFLAATGLRIGELVGLQWRDIDFEAQRVHVRRRYYRGSIDTPKSRYGIRRVPMPATIADQLRERRSLAHYDGPTDWVFGSLIGTPMSSRNFRERVFNPAREAAGVPWATLHTLRHTCASRLFRLGWSPKHVQIMLGHHSPAFTMSTYVHIMPDELPDTDALG